MQPTAKKPFFVGIDVGGTNIKIGLVDDAGQTLAYHSMRTEQDKGAEDACARMAVVVRRTARRSTASTRATSPAPASPRPARWILPRA